MIKYNIAIKLSEWTAYSLDAISQKTGVDYTNLIRIAIKDLIRKELTLAEYTSITRKLIDVKTKQEQIDDIYHKQWIDHYNSLSEEHKDLLDQVYEKILQLKLTQKDFFITEKGEKWTPNKKIPGWDKLSESEKQRLFIMMKEN